MKVKRTKYGGREGRCECGRRVRLDDPLWNACECGRWYNILGQEVKDPNTYRPEFGEFEDVDAYGVTGALNQKEDDDA